MSFMAGSRTDNGPRHHVRSVFAHSGGWAETKRDYLKALRVLGIVMLVNAGVFGALWAGSFVGDSRLVAAITLVVGACLLSGLLYERKRYRVRLGDLRDEPERKAMLSSVALEESQHLQQEDITASAKKASWRPEIALPLVGRARELQSIRQAVAAGSHVIGLTGVAGVGKTTLAAAATELLAKDFERRLWVSGWRQPYPTYQAILEELAAQLGERFRWASSHEVENVLTQRLSAFRTLIILDELDSLPSTELERFLSWTKRLPRATALYTSRTPPAPSPGAFVLQVDPFSQTEAADYLRNKLSEQRRSIPTQAGVLEAFAERSGGIPLLLRFSAAWLAKTDIAHFDPNRLPPKVDAAQFIIEYLDSAVVGSAGRDMLAALAVFEPDASLGALRRVSTIASFRETLGHLDELELAIWARESSRVEMPRLAREVLLRRMQSKELPGGVRERYVHLYVEFVRSPQQRASLGMEMRNILNAVRIAYEAGDTASAASILQGLHELIAFEEVIHSG